MALDWRVDPFRPFVVSCWSFLGPKDTLLGQCFATAKISHFFATANESGSQYQPLLTLESVAINRGLNWE